MSGNDIVTTVDDLKRINSGFSELKEVISALAMRDLKMWELLLSLLESNSLADVENQQNEIKSKVIEVLKQNMRQDTEQYPLIVNRFQLLNADLRAVVQLLEAPHREGKNN